MVSFTTHIEPLACSGTLFHPMQLSMALYGYWEVLFDDQHLALLN